MSIHDVSIHTLDGKTSSLGEYAGNALLVVNVASQCGLTPQYEGLQQLHEKYAGRGLAVLGFPCNQFGEQEPGSAEEIREFVDTKYGVTFPLFEKIDVNGAGRHPLYEALVDTADAEGHSGDIRWNFEKFVVSPSGEVVARFSPMTTPDDPALVATIEAQLPG